MTFRLRIVIATSLAVAVAVIIACAGAWYVAKNSLVSSADDSLSAAATQIDRGPFIDTDALNGQIFQVIYANGTVLASSPFGTLPVGPVARSIATGDNEEEAFASFSDNGAYYRELIIPLDAGQVVGANQQTTTMTTSGALQIAVPLNGIDRQLRHLELALLLVAILGTVLAALFGWLVARLVIRPLDAVTEGIEQLAETTDVTQRLDEGGKDELGRLRRSFNSLLSALDRSQIQQRQLVLDASHELRTPLTSMRTNAQVLQQFDRLEAEDRKQLLNDVMTQVDEMTSLVGDITELARSGQTDSVATTEDLDEMVQLLVDVFNAHGRARGITFEAHLEPTRVFVHRDRVHRAISNLLSNALKFSPDGSTISVTLADGTLEVTDQGPGIKDEDLTKIFDRFYRSDEARALPGSGLGLSIVAEVVADEGGTIEALNAPGGGATLRLTLPTTS